MRNKLLLAVVIAVSFSISAFADSKVKSGNVDILNDDSIECKVVFDFSKTSIEDIPFEDYMVDKGVKFVKEWNEEVIPIGLQFFTRTWNKENKRGLKVAEECDSDYTLVIAPTFIDLGSSAAATFVGFGAGGCRFDGKLLIYKGKTELLEIVIKDQSGKGSAKAKYRFADLMKELVEDTLDDIL